MLKQNSILIGFKWGDNHVKKDNIKKGYRYYLDRSMLPNGICHIHASIQYNIIYCREN